jgi:hypothetical protein
MQAQGCQPRGTLLEIFLDLRGHDYWKARNVFTEDLYGGPLHPSLPETDSRRVVAYHPAVRALVDRVLKHRNPRFVPQAMPEENRRIGGCRQYRSSDQLCHVVNPSETLRRHLEMQLETRATGLQHYAVMYQLQLI